MHILKTTVYLTAVLLAVAAGPAAQATSHNTSCADRELIEAGKLSGEGTSVGFIIGARWGQGVVTMNDGTRFNFKAKGGKGLEYGAATAKFTGTVYNLSKPADFAGVYSGMGGGVTVAEAGKGGAHYTNGNCVVLKIKRTETKGLQSSTPMLGVIDVEVVE